MALALALSGCASAPLTPKPAPSPSAPDWSAHGPITFASPGDPTGQLAADIHDWNALHPDEPVTLRELPDSTDAQRDDVVARATSGDGEYTVMAVDVAWLQQLAATGGVAALPASLFPTQGLLGKSVDAGTQDGALFAYPYTAGAGVLYYRKDLLGAAKLSAPTTWTQMASDCLAILGQHRSMSCYSGQYRPGEDLSVNVIEAIQGAGGTAFAADGTPTLDTDAATAGLTWLNNWFSTGATPTAALAYDDDLSREAFERGSLVFWRGWSDQWSLLGLDPGAVVRPAQVGVVELPGRSGVSPSVFDGLSLAVSSHGGNLGTARDFIVWLTGRQRQVQRFATAGAGPVLDALYTDKAVTGANPVGAILDSAVTDSMPRPVEADYAALSKALSDGAYPALSDNKPVPAALASTQEALAGIIAKR